MNIGYEAKRVFHNQTGLGNYGRDLVRMLSEHYPENKYYLYNPKSARQRLFEPNGTHVFERLPQSRFNRTFYNLWRQRNMVGDVKKDGIELFHGLSGEIPVGLGRHRIKSIVTIHDLIFVRYPQLFSYIDCNIYFRKFRYAAHRADRIIAISEQTKRDIVEFLNVDETKVEVIYQGCHPAFKQRYDEYEKEQIRKKYSLPTSFILNVGTIEERKNVLSVVKAIKHLSDTCLVIVGKETEYAKEVRTYIRHNGLQKNVLFAKGLSIRELAIVYQLAKLFIYPSRFEGFGIPIIEALHSGVPVITTNTGCFPEAGGPHSTYVSPDDVAGIGQAIEDLLTDTQLRTEMVDKGFEYAQRFNDAPIARQLMACYGNVLRG
ncbi:glycosyltransferase family 4 protein [Parapedobacter tibetensis]|uniref:glycosyltransferase family 4 protein n=1 Tax=Parapedobacter tibetensis TaxID=2972951 RepID=UPI00214D5E48|nr:glycosyltransferase family 1 protein [Parapedobacter tibetensis]